jgi:hypothetical protein
MGESAHGIDIGGSHDVHDGAPSADGVAVHGGQQTLREHLEQLLGLLHHQTDRQGQVRRIG